MLWNLLVFALIGFLAGVVARWLIPGRQSMGILATTALGIVGSLVGGLISGFFWPAADNQIHSAGLLMSVVGAVVALGLYVVYTRRSRA